MSTLIKQLRDYINFVDDIELRRIAANQLEQLEAKVVTQQARIEQLREAIKLYDQALMESWPEGAMGDAFDYWNAARATISTTDDLSALRAHDEKLLKIIKQKDEAILQGNLSLALSYSPDAIDDLSALRAHDEKLLATNTQAAKDVLAERERQKSVEGWTPEHDDQHRKGALAAAGGCYALFADYYLAEGHPPEFWPWDAKWWKPSLARRNLIKAGALILAEIERFDRADAIEKGGDK